MIALLLMALQTPDPVVLTSLGRQAMPARGCAAFLWRRGPEPALVAMATADPAQLRLSPAGKIVDAGRAAQSGGDAGYGFQRRVDYVAGDLTATLEMAISQRPDLTEGAIVDATLTVARAGAPTAIVPVGGLIACRPAG